jgi:hypothetical protein
MADNKDVSFHTPENPLQKKTGTGGLPDSFIVSAQSMGDCVEFDFPPFATKKIVIMKAQLNYDEFLAAQNDNTIEAFLFNLVPFDVNAKLAKNMALSLISDNLLKFIEGLPSINVDSHHVIRAHVNALSVLTARNIDDANNPVIKKLVSELKEACERYHTKYKEHKGTIEEWAVG